MAIPSKDVSFYRMGGKTSSNQPDKRVKSKHPLN
uniref:Uncharacterized protein n=1 Tax=Rhizophora mucronata TaxID=61149 RepID=A0A2P2NYE5_RHIMU